ncbi:MAG TPA: ABC transporter substrate-binding protein [Lachnospiraceae bacterium]
MKRKIRIDKILLLTLMGSLFFAGCGKKEETETDLAAETVETEAVVEEKESIKAVKVGASLLVDSKEAKLCLDGFIKGMEEEGYIEPSTLTLVPDFAGGTSLMAGENTKKFVEKEIDLLFSLGSMATVSAHTALKGEDIPLVYAGVANPDEVGLSDFYGVPKDEFTIGISDKSMMEDELNLIKTIYPNLNKIAFIYTVGNQNALKELNIVKGLAAARGITVVEGGIYQVKDVEEVALKLSKEADAFLMLSDENTDLAIETILSVSRQKNIPVFANSQPQVEAGALAGICKDYQEMGKKAGILAAKILKGKTVIKEAKVEKMQNGYLCLNKSVAERLNIEFTEILLRKAKEVYK